MLITLCYIPKRNKNACEALNRVSSFRLDIRLTITKIKDCLMLGWIEYRHIVDTKTHFYNDDLINLQLIT